MTTELNNQTNTGNPKVSSGNIAFKWGAIGGLASLIFGLAMYYAYGGQVEKMNSSMQTAVSAVIIFFATYMAMKEVRNTQLGGYIGFGKAYRTGLLVSAIMILFSIIYSFVLFNYMIDFDLMLGGMMDESMKQMKERGMSEAEMEKGISYLKYMTPTSFVIWGTVFLIVLHLIIDLISAAVAKKDQPQN